MAPKSLSLLFVLLSLLSALISSEAASGVILGGYRLVDPNDPNVVDVAKFAVTEHNKEANTSLVFVSVFKAERQVVAGTNFRLAIATKDRKLYCAVVFRSLRGSLRLVSFEPSPRSLLGAYRLADPKRRDVVKAAKFALKEHNKVANTSLKFVSVIAAQTQLVAGINYQVVIAAKDGNYYLAVVFRSLRGSLKLVSFNPAPRTVPGGCTPPNPKPLLGSYKLADQNDPEVVNVAKFAVTEHNKNANTSLVFVSVFKAEKQVVAGTNYQVVLAAKDGGASEPKNYRAVVSSNLQKSLKLVSFERAQN